MGRKKHGKLADAPELDITAFLNLMVVLVPFLLVSAVFSRITILELNTPTSAGASKPTKPRLNLEIVIRGKGLEIANGRKVLARFPKVDDKYPLQELSRQLVGLKKKYPEKTDATILMEPDIKYDHLISVMDYVRNAVVTQAGQEEVQKIPLFPDISIGDAP